MSVKLKKKDSPHSLAYSPEDVTKLLSLVHVYKKENNNLHEDLLAIIRCKSNGKDQLVLFKELCVKLKKLMNDDMVEELISIFSEMFIHCTSRHPLRRSMTSYFQSFNEKLTSTFMETMSVKLNRYLELNQDKRVSDNGREVVELITALMENFKIGDKIISMNCKSVLVYLHRTLVNFIDFTKNNVNLIVQTQMMHHCLATIKTILAVLQRSQGSILNENINKENDKINVTLLKLSTDISVDNFMTLECCSAAAMVIPSIALNLSDKEIYGLLNQFITGYDNADATETLFCNLKESIQCLMLHDHSSVLVLLHAFLVKLSPAVLHTTIEGLTTTYIEHIFVDKLIDISLKSHNKHLLVLTFKTILLWVTNITQPINGQISSHVIQLITSSVVSHLLNYVNYPIDTIRHSVNKTLELCFQFLSTNNANQFVLELSQYYFTSSMKSRGNIAILKTLTQFVCVSDLLQTRPLIPVDIISLLSDVDLASHGCDLYKLLAEQHFKEIAAEDVPVWIDAWVNVTYSFLNESNLEIKKGIVNYIIPSLLKIHPRLVTIYVSSIKNNSGLIKARVAIVLLKAYRSMKNFAVKEMIGFKTEETTCCSDLWKMLLPMDYMKMCCVHADMQVCLDSITLVCSSVKTTDPIDSNDIELIHHFMKYNMASESPSFRQQLITNIKKILLRMFAHAYQIEHSSTTDKTSLALYAKFMEWLIEICVGLLYPTAPYSQISIALDLLSLVTIIFTENEKSMLLKNMKISSELKLKYTLTLLACFHDSYDPNRQLVYGIFKNQPIFSCDLSNENAAVIFHDALKRLCSPQPDVSSVAAYYLSYLAMKLSTEQIYTLFMQHDTSFTCTHFTETADTALNMLEFLMMLLKKQLTELKHNLYLGAQNSPLYGVLYSMRLLFTFKGFNLNHGVAKIYVDKFNRYLQDLVDVYIEIIVLVSKYVSSDAPEGHLCDASLGEIFQLLNLHADETNIEMEAHIARMLLVCCWRSMKEVSLLLGVVVSSFSSILPKSLLMNIWHMFCDILLRSKHAGAYELASLGFVKLCNVLWNSNDSDLKEIPHKALNTLVQDLLSVDTYDKAQVTRRSAGLPFYLKALCVTEPLIKSKQSFKYLMTSLVKLCLDQLNTHDINKVVIALNILRAFFKDSNLCEDVYEYVSDGVVISLSGFSSCVWGIRNSSTLLFSALMQRIFGVKKCKMTGREFFSRYPSLYKFLMIEAEQMSQFTNNQSHPSIFPVLLLLSHLYPSSVEGSETLMKLNQFLPHVLRCGSSAIYKTRTMAARAIVPLISKEKSHTFIVALLSDVCKTYIQENNENLLHGSLLQIQELLNHLLSIHEDIHTEEGIMDLLFSLGVMLQTKGSFLAKSIFTDMLSTLMRVDTKVLNKTLYEQHFILVKGYFKTPSLTLHTTPPPPPSTPALTTTACNNFFSTSRQPGFVIFLRSAAQFICDFCKMEVSKHNKAPFIQEMLELLHMDVVEVQSTILGFIKIEFNNFMLTQQNVKQFLTLLQTSDNDVFIKALGALSSLLASRKTINDELIIEVWKRISKENEADKISDELRCCTIEFIMALYESKTIFAGVVSIKEVWYLLHMSSLDSNAEFTRLNVAKMLAYVRFTDDVMINTAFIYRYYHCCINLLRDADAAVRQTCAINIYHSMQLNAGVESDSFFKPQSTYVMEMFFEKQLQRQFLKDPINCVIFLLSLLIETDFYSLVSTNRRIGQNSSTDNSDSFIKSFIVFEESKSNPYFDLQLVSKFVKDLLTNLMTSTNIDLTSCSDYYRLTDCIKCCQEDFHENLNFNDFMRIIKVEI